MFAPKTKFQSFGAALPFPNTNITNYCFSAILKGLKLSSSSSAVNTSQFDNCQSFCCHVCPENKVSSFGAALSFPSTIITNYCFSAILKGLKLSSSSSAVNTSQFDNCQSCCCHVCSENKVSEFWRRSTLSKFNYYKLLLFCILKKNV